MLGSCRLCQTPNAQLRNSHYLPKAIYRQLRDRSVAKPDPWVIIGNSSYQTSKQMTAYLLCDACEGALSANGEDWGLKRFQRLDGTFELASILSAQLPVTASADNPTKVYTAGTVPTLDPDAMAYFAASVFWRGSIYPWNYDGSIPVPLGRYGEEFRQYLRGEQDFPTHALLNLLHFSSFRSQC